jgi:folate-binding protein YgfZ
MIVLEPAVLNPSQREALLSGAVVVTPDQPIIAIEGPGAADCLQGVLTNDVNAQGDGAFVYGAILTTKGMIECDLWTARLSSQQLEIYPSTRGLESLTAVLQRFFPPRLAKTTNLTEQRSILQLVGPEALTIAQRSGIMIPEPGHARRSRDSAYIVARPPLGRPFALQIAAPRDLIAQTTDRLVENGAETAGDAALDLTRVLDGWPRLGSEIGEKTLPQEVRYDEIDGVSYTKGCYTGQETVARIHFRGHPNRRLVGLRWQDEPDTTSDEIVRNDKVVGRVTTMAWIDDERGYAGLGVLRREVEVGEEVVAAQETATVTDLPFTRNSGSLVG